MVSRATEHFQGAQEKPSSSACSTTSSLQRPWHEGIKPAEKTSHLASATQKRECFSRDQSEIWNFLRNITSNTLDRGLGKVSSSEFGLESKFGPISSLMICSHDGEEYRSGKNGRPRQGEQSNTGVTYTGAGVADNEVFMLRTKRSPGPDDDNKLLVHIAREQHSSCEKRICHQPGTKNPPFLNSNVLIFNYLSY